VADLKEFGRHCFQTVGLKAEVTGLTAFKEKRSEVQALLDEACPYVQMVAEDLATQHRVLRHQAVSVLALRYAEPNCSREQLYKAVAAMSTEELEIAAKGYDMALDEGFDDLIAFEEQQNNEGTYAHFYSHAHTHTHTYIHTHTQTHTHTHTHTCTRAHAYMHTYTHPHVCIIG
jgi:hypothetical protein